MLKRRTRSDAPTTRGVSKKPMGEGVADSVVGEGPKKGLRGGARESERP